MGFDHDIPILTAAPTVRAEVSDYSGEYQVIGPPGCGKTTYIKSQVEKIMRHYHGDAVRKATTPNPILVCSLTKTAAYEAASRVLGSDYSPDRKYVGTLHAHAFRALGFPAIATGKALAGFNAAFPEYTLPLSEGGTDSADDLLPTDSGGTETPGMVHLEAYELARHADRDLGELPRRTIEFIEAYEGWKESEGLLDFTDLILRAEILGAEGLGPSPPKVVLVDEAQDMSAIEFRLIRSWGAIAGATIAVGDPLQALYTWRGADPSQLASDKVPSDRRRVLGQSYRVPEAVVETSLAWARRLSDFEPIEYRPRAGDPGSVSYTSLSLATTEGLVSAIEHSEAEGSVMVIATCGYMLHGLIARLRARGVPFANPWRLRQGAWNPITASSGRTYPSRVAGFFDGSRAVHGPSAGIQTWRSVEGWVSTLSAGAFAKRGVKTAVESIADEAGDEPVGDAEWSRVFGPQAFEILALMDAPDEAVRWLTGHAMPKYHKGADYVGAVFESRGVSGLVEPPRVFVGTAHSFKGAEADTVILFPDVSPQAAAGMERGTEDADSVVRSFYVGMTRARRDLVLGSPMGRNSVRWEA